MKVIIVGGGIGGLTTALMLHARGIDCELYEQSDGHAIIEKGQVVWSGTSAALAADATITQRYLQV